MNINDLKINEEYQRLVPDLTKEEYTNLKNDIKKDNEIYIPIIINKEGYVLDGHHRKRIAEELGITSVPIKEVNFKDPLDEKAFVIRSNLHRRQLQLYQKAFLADELHKIEQQKIAERTPNKRGRPSEDIPKFLGMSEKKPRKKAKKINTDAKRQIRKATTRLRAAKAVNLSDETLRQYQHVKKHGNTELTEAMTKGHIPISKAYEKIQYLKLQEERRKEIERKEKEITENINNDWPKLYCGKFQEIEIPDNSIDLIFTDPPYDREHILLYKDLASLAATKLKPGGSLVCYANHYFLPQTFDLMKHEDLEYWWTIGEFHQSQSHSKMFKQNITVSWKPLLWFVKKGAAPHNVKTMTMFADSIRSNPPENKKLEHKWEQSLDDAVYIIDKLSDKGDIILDPMCGSGTSGVAVETLGRRFIGIDELQEHIDETKTRMLFKKEK